MQKDNARYILQFMLEFGGLWKHQVNPACTKSVFVMLKLDAIRKNSSSPSGVA